MKHLAILGSTGSIGTQTLEVVDALGNYQVDILSAHRNKALLYEQVRKYQPKHVFITDKTTYEYFKGVQNETPFCRYHYLWADYADCLEGIDCVIGAITGAAGIEPVLDSLRAGLRIGLANKETMEDEWKRQKLEAMVLMLKGALEALAEGFDLTFTYQRETTSWLHPGISAAVYCNGKRLGVFGKLANEINAELEIAKEQKDSQNIYLGELDYEALMSCVEGELRYKPLSPYAAVKRDLALVCDEAVACGDIEETIKKASPLITEVKLFDIYRGANLGEGKKSMAFSLTLSDPAAEVSNEQVERTVKKVLGNLKFKLGIEIR